MISMAELTHFEASESLRASTAQLTTNRVTEPMDGTIAGLQYFGLALRPRIAAPSLLEDPVSLSPTSFLSLLQIKYANWETGLSDSRSLTDVNGVSVYPIVQINYGRWHLPIPLYISPLRGSDAR